MFVKVLMAGFTGKTNKYLTDSRPCSILSGERYGRIKNLCVFVAKNNIRISRGRKIDEHKKYCRPNTEGQKFFSQTKTDETA